MEDDISKKVQARFAELPQDVQAAVQSADLSTRIQKIGERHKLHIDQMGVLQDETLLVMLGFEALDTLSKNIEKALNIQREESTALAVDIGNEIFTPIRESLKKFSERAALQAKASSTPATPPSPAPTQKPAAPPATSPQTTLAQPSPKPSAPQTIPSVPAITHPHDLMLTQKTVAVTSPGAPAPSVSISGQALPTKPEALKPTDYKTDPYREPPE